MTPKQVPSVNCVSIRFIYKLNDWFQVKVWTTITNSTVTIVTENLSYHEFLVFDGDNIDDNNGFHGDDIDLGNRIHFLGNFKELTLLNNIEENGQNKCVFKTKCEDCLYIILTVFNAQDDDSAKICEVDFSWVILYIWSLNIFSHFLN